MDAGKSWLGHTRLSIPADNIGLLLLYLYQLKGMAEESHVFSYSYHNSDCTTNTVVNYPLYISSDRWVANEERPLQVEEPLSVGESASFTVNEAYLKWKRGKQLILNNPTYSLVGVETSLSAGIRLCFGKATYEQFISTCEILNDELKVQLEKNHKLANLCKTREGINGNSEELFELWNDLPIRRRFAPNKAALTNFGLRSMKLGIVVAVAFRASDAEDAWIVPISKRGTRLAEYPDSYGMIPSGSFQPCAFKEWTSGHDLKQDNEFDLRYSVLREYLEEVLGLENEKELGLKPEELLEGQEFWEFVQLAKNGKVRFAWTGLAIALETGKPDLTCLLTIDDPDYYKKYQGRFKSNWESTNVVQVSYDEDGIRPFLAGLPIAPSAAMALTLGLKVLRAPWFTYPDFSFIKRGTPLAGLL